ncbi:putative component of NuA3 histone acetyltransferase complex [Coemansia javaensis]|uniref:Component of NuA3 histone acetyltransferase complex n=1 Tax=Coemansia javaensis TaxID=2761396 RepID=A0A9W8H6Y6_9FUNG|nr:putative component of NuA3 histone acetyltransferase complex [Coemansia javaensis]
MAEARAEKRARTSDDSSDGSQDAEPLRLAAGYLDGDFADRFRTAFTGASSDCAAAADGPGAGGEVVARPFATGRLRGVLPGGFLRALRAELAELAWHERSNDLYWFHQTDDLALEGRQHVRRLRDYMAGDEFVGLMERLTGVRLSRGHLDMAAQRYKKGNHLLCHDDDVRRGEVTRKIAYILYLVDEQWDERDGGALALFATDQDGHPTDAVARIVPEFGSMGFFLTGHASFHTVEEVTVECDQRERWSVTGWFYGPAADDDAHTAAPAELQAASVLPHMAALDTGDGDDDDDDDSTWARWISAEYRKPDVQARVQDVFLEQSSVELRDFVAPAVFGAALAELQAAAWATTRKPAHVCRHLETQPAAGTVLAGLCGFLRSASFGRFLERVTGLELAGASQQVRRFERGHYTLVNDQALDPDGLDAVLCMAAPGAQWGESWGGATHYIADQDELLRISPEPNSLSLVLRDEGTLRFVKYVNHMAQAARQDISMVFVEQLPE